MKYYRKEIMIKKIPTLTLALLLSASAAQAVTLGGFSATGVTTAGAFDLPAGSSTYLIVDGGDGFDFLSVGDMAAGLSFTNGSVVTGTNDYVFAYNASQAFGAGASVISGNTTFSLTDNAGLSGNAFALVYWDSETTASVTSAAGKAFGFHTDASWVVPTSESANETFGGGGIFAGLSGITTSGTVVPEPCTYAALAGLLALGYVMVRRRGA